MKPICVPCQRFFRPEKSGFCFTEGMPIGAGLSVPGTSHPERWRPYKLWRGDKWKCQGCGAEIVIGASEPFAIQHEDGFTQLAKETKADQYQVNDC